jgi:hypothetical protein
MTVAMTEHYSHVDQGEKKAAVEGAFLTRPGEPLDVVCRRRVNWAHDAPAK